MSKRLLVGGVVAIAVLLGAIGVLYVYGAPQPGSTALPEQTNAAPAGEWVEVAEEDAASAPGGTEPQAAAPADGQVPEPDPNSPLAISIPGCKCHSDDPKLVKEHEGYRMNQCAGCHAGKVPTGQ